MARVLIIGRRKQSYKAARRLGHKVFLWADGHLHESRKKKLDGWIEVPFSEAATATPPTAVADIRNFGIQYVVAATESSVDLAARVRRDFGLPGTTLNVSNLLHNKYEMKKAARLNKIPIADFHLIERSDNPDQLISKIGLPLVIKPVSESGARGVVVAKDAAEVEQHLKPGLLAESFVDGSEVSVETLIYKSKPIFHNVTTYLHQWKQSILPADLNCTLRDKIIAINDRVIDSFGVENGMTHSEFYLSKRGPVFGEMAVRPPGGYYMELIQEAYGFDPWEAYVQIECGGSEPQINQKPRKYAAVHIIHPGQGKIRSIDGVEQVKRLPEVFDYKFKVNVGDEVPGWASTSSECGHLLVSGSDNDELVKRLEYIDRTIQLCVDPQ